MSRKELDRAYTSAELARWGDDFALARNGVAIRAPLEGDPAFVGMEIQIQDTYYYRKLKDYEVFGSVYGVAPAKTGHLKPNGQWNSEEIICLGITSR